MIYCCESCGFLFSRVGEVQNCPFCEGDRFRAATAEEARKLQEILLRRANGGEETTTKEYLIKNI